MEALLVLLIGLGLLYLWARDHVRVYNEKVAERQKNCPHPPESQRSIRVNNIFSISPAYIDRVIPGRRWLVKCCDACGKQRPMYHGKGGHMQKWEDFEREWHQETIDRNYQYEARRRFHEAELAERRAKEKRKKTK